MSRFLKLTVGLVLLVACGLQVSPTFAAGGGEGHGVHVGMDEDTSEQLLDLSSPESFQKSFKTDLAIYTFVVFALLLVTLWFTAFGPIAKALHDREEGIRKDIEEAKTEREKAEALRGEYQGLLEAAQDKVREIHAEANAKAEELRAKRVAEADQEAETRIQQAVQEIERAKDQAIAELFQMENQRIVQATEHVLGRALSNEDQDRLVNDALSSFSGGQQAS